MLPEYQRTLGNDPWGPTGRMDGGTTGRRAAGEGRCVHATYSGQPPTTPILPACPLCCQAARGGTTFLTSCKAASMSVTERAVCSGNARFKTEKQENVQKGKCLPPYIKNRLEQNTPLIKTLPKTGLI